MQYIIEDHKNTITIKSENEQSTIIVNENRISIFEVLRILVENSVEVCHAQNVYDDLIVK